MRDFLKSRLQKLPEGVIVNTSGVETHVESGNRTVKRNDSRRKFFISPHLYFCGFEGAQ